MSNTWRYACITATMLVFCTVGTAKADKLRYEMTGTLFDVFISGSVADPSAVPFEIDGAFKLIVEYDTSVAGTMVSSFKYSYAALTDLEFDYEDGKYLADLAPGKSGSIGISNNNPAGDDVFTVASGDSTSFPDVAGLALTDSSFSLELEDDSALVFSSAMPLPSLAGAAGFFDEVLDDTLVAMSWDDESIFIAGTIDSVTLVPEPASLTLLALGAGTLLRRRRA